MDLYIKQKVFSWGDKFSIYDGAGNEVFYVEGEVFSFGKKLHLYDMQENELAYIEQKVWSFLPKYYINVNGQQIAEVVKEFTFFHPEYTVNGLGWSVHGDFFDHDYDIVEGDRLIVNVAKEWFTWGDAYRVRIAHDADVVAALSVVLVIDACIEASQNNN